MDPLDWRVMATMAGVTLTVVVVVGVTVSLVIGWPAPVAGALGGMAGGIAGPLTVRYLWPRSGRVKSSPDSAKERP
jgi:hypothetical protein